MKTVIVFLGSLIFCLYSHAQLIDVRGGIYTHGCYSMQTLEGWKRVEANGYPYIHRKGYINFTTDRVTIQIGATSTEREVYKNLKFQYEAQNIKHLVFYSDLQPDYFPLIDSQGNSFFLYYFNGSYFRNNKNIFILCDLKGNIMYFLEPSNDVSSIVSRLYK